MIQTQYKTGSKTGTAMLSLDDLPITSAAHGAYRASAHVLAVEVTERTARWALRSAPLYR